MIEDLIEKVPAYSEFPTVHELYESDRELAKSHPEIVELKNVGTSKRGNPIQALQIGEGRYQAVLFGFPHPEEPCGAVVLDYLAAELAENRDLREGLDFTWHIVKCADPDGAKLNEPWFKGFSLRKFALNYYRPPSHKQVEWSFPVRYKVHVWRTPIPETRAIMNLIDSAKPDFISSLHMSRFGGVYFYVSYSYPELFERFYQVVKAQGLPLHLGEPEVPYRSRLADAVFKMPIFEDSYDYYEKQLGEVPEELLKRGTSSYGYARSISKPFTLVNEVPFLFNDDAADMTPTLIERRHSKLEALKRSELAFRFIKDQFQKTKAELDRASPFYEMIIEHLRRTGHMLEAERRWVQTEPSMERKATVAELFDSTVAIVLEELCQYGAFMRLLRESQSEAKSKSIINSCLKATRARFEEVYETFEKDAHYEVIPIQKLTRVQLASLLYSADYLKQVR